MTDPCFVSSKSNFEQACHRHETQHAALSQTSPPTLSLSSPPSLLVELCITPELYASLQNAPPESNYAMASESTDETYYAFGETSSRLSDYQLIGLHGSDSRMTCIVPKNPYEQSMALFGTEHSEVYFTLSPSLTFTFTFTFTLPLPLSLSLFLSLFLSFLLLLSLTHTPSLFVIHYIISPWAWHASSCRTLRSIGTILS